MAIARPAELTPEQVAQAWQLLDVEQWAVNVAKISLPKTGRMDLTQHPYLREIFRDMSQEIVLMKGAQMGMSTVAFIRAFWFLTTFPTSVIYTMPTSTDVMLYTQARINPIISRSEYLSDRIVALDSVMQKQFAVAPGVKGHRFGKRSEIPRSTVYFRGSAGDKDTRALDADMLIHDEEDLSNPQAIEQFESRLDASKWKMRFRLSTPRLPGAGIDRAFRRTDQHRWFVKCSGCNAEFELAPGGGPWDYGNIEPDTFEEYRRLGTARYKCHLCGKTITDEQRLNGRWVATDPGADKVRGYAISQLSAVWVPAWRILERRHRATWEQDFWNLVVGIPWQSEQFGFTRESILALVNPVRQLQHLPEEGQTVFMGVDPGGVHDWVCQVMGANGPEVIGMGTASDWHELEQVYLKWRPAVCVIDGRFDPTKAEEFAQKYNVAGRSFIWLAIANAGNTGRTLVSWDDKTNRVGYARHAMLTATADEMARSPGLLPRYDAQPIFDRWIQHHVNSQKVPVWVKGLEVDRVVDHYEWHEVGPDHMFHAMLYAMLARQRHESEGVPLVGLRSFRRGKDVTPTPYLPSVGRRRPS